MRLDADWFIGVETLNSGKPAWEAEGDILGCADSLDLFAGYVPSLSGTHMPVPPNPAS